MRLHRGRRARLRAALAASGVAAVALTGGILAAPATAAPAADAPSTALALTTAAGDGQLSASWNAVPGATAYTVHWGPGAKRTRTTVVTGTSVRIPGVVNRKAYSVSVSAVGAVATSAPQTVQPVPYVPVPITGVTAVPAGPDRIRVSWTGGGRARSVKVIAGADSMTEVHHFSTGWLPAAVHSTVLTVPAALHDVLGGGSGNVVFVKVAQSNSAERTPAEHLTFSLADRYRLTPSGTWSLAGAAQDDAPASRVSVATWNVQSVTASAGYSPADRWSARLPKVAANIEANAPDLIGLQELTTARIQPACLNPRGRLDCVEQYETLQTALADAPTPYRNARTDGNAWVYAHPGSYVDSNLFYDPAKLQVLDSGFISPRGLLGRAWPSSMPDEAGMWARFGVLDAAGAVGRTFLAVSVHLPAGDHAAIRSAEAAAIAQAMDRRAAQPDGTALPIVFVGDFNDNGAQVAGSGSLQLRAAGYVDAAATPDRTNMRFSTANQSNGRGGADGDYPLVLTPHPYPTSRIDYIMLKGSPHPVSYRNLVPIEGDRFDSALQGSDHNMQLAVVGIGDPVR